MGSRVHSLRVTTLLVDPALPSPSKNSGPDEPNDRGTFWYDDDEEYYEPGDEMTEAW